MDALRQNGHLTGLPVDPWAQQHGRVDRGEQAECGHPQQAGSDDALHVYRGKKQRQRDADQRGKIDRDESQRHQRRRFQHSAGMPERDARHHAQRQCADAAGGKREDRGQV